jgi:uncharacterized protein YbjT (DUF2867 family)
MEGGNRSMATVLVTAGTGKIGTEFAQLCANHPDRPFLRFATRDPSSRRADLLRKLAPDRFEPIALDVDDPGSLMKAMTGVDAIMLIAPFIPDMGPWHAKIAEAAKAAGVAFVVKVSVTGAREPVGEPKAIPERHGAGEKALRQSGVPFTAIRPTIFAQHFMMSPGLYVAGADRFYLPTGPGQIAFLDCRDIAALGLALITAEADQRDQHAGKAYELTGGAAFTAAEIAEILSAVAGREITHVDGEEAFVARCAELGVPDAIKAVYHEAGEGWFSAVDTGPFEALVGRMPRSFVHFAIDYAPHFAAR